jgi:glutamine synthetase
MRSKVKATDEKNPPDWSFDGSSTKQAEGGSSDCLLIPVQTYSNPNGHDLVLTQVQSADHTTHPSNFRASAAEIVTDEWWFGFEQEFFFTDSKTANHLVGKMVFQKNRVNIIVELVPVMLLGEKFPTLIFRHVLMLVLH